MVFLASPVAIIRWAICKSSTSLQWTCIEIVSVHALPREYMRFCFAQVLPVQLDLSAHPVYKALMDSPGHKVRQDSDHLDLRGRLEVQATRADLVRQVPLVQAELLALPDQRGSEVQVCTWICSRELISLSHKRPDSHCEELILLHELRRPELVLCLVTAVIKSYMSEC